MKVVTEELAETRNVLLRAKRDCRNAELERSQIEEQLEVLRLFPPHAPSSHAQGSSGVVATMPFVWRGRTKSPTTRPGRALTLTCGWNRAGGAAELWVHLLLPGRVLQRGCATRSLVMLEGREGTPL